MILYSDYSTTQDHEESSYDCIEIELTEKEMRGEEGIKKALRVWVAKKWAENGITPNLDGYDNALERATQAAFDALRAADARQTGGVSKTSGTSLLFDIHEALTQAAGRVRRARVRAYKYTRPVRRRERRSSRRSRSSFVAASSHAGSDSGSDDGGGSDDGDGQSDSHHVGTGHEARVDFGVDSQQNKSIEKPGIAARSDALAVAGFFVPSERAEAAA